MASGKPFPVGPDKAYAKLLGSTFGALDAKVAKGRKALTRNGAQFDDQAAAARDIQAAYAAAARRLGNAAVGPAARGINGLLIERLTAASGAWKRAASAAAGKDKAGFDRSEAAIERTQERLAQAVARLEDAGYTLER